MHSITIMSQITIEPAVREWKALAEKNRSTIQSAVARGEFKGVSLAALNEFRDMMLAAARRFTTDQLGSVSAQNSPDALILASGHQPVVYHSGVMRKVVTLSHAAQSFGAAGLNVIIDTDEGESGKFTYPQCGGAGLPQIGTAQLSEGGGLYFSQRIKSSAEIRPAFENMFSSLETLSGVSPEARESLRSAEAAYLAAAGKSAVTGNTQVRRIFGGAACVNEIPLTTLISIPFARAFYAQVIETDGAFSARFNELLNQFRLKRKIKNHANPFPNLQIAADRAELPFWVIDRQRGTRAPLFFRTQDQMLTFEGGELCPAAASEDQFDWASADRFRLAPRAFMITALLRLFACDLFVHGLGGGKYDAFLDDFIAAYWRIPPPSFAIVSETRSFFPEKVSELDRKLEVLSKTREIQFHLGAYLNNGTFPVEVSAVLREHWQARERLVERVKEIKSQGGSAFEVTQELKRVDLAIKETLTQFFSSIEVPPEGVQYVLRFREFPFFFFPAQDGQ